MDEPTNRESNKEMKKSQGKWLADFWYNALRPKPLCTISSNARVHMDHCYSEIQIKFSRVHNKHIKRDQEITSENLRIFWRHSSISCEDDIESTELFGGSQTRVPMMSCHFPKHNKIQREKLGNQSQIGREIDRKSRESEWWLQVIGFHFWSEFFVPLHNAWERTHD
jgi:hypothetical protein